MAWAVTAAAAVITAGTGVATAISGTADARKRTQFVQQLELLDYDQKKKLNDDLIKANSEEARQQILGNTLGGISGKRVDTLGALAIEKEKTNKVVTIIGLGAGILLFGGVILVLIDKKN
jgi:N-acetylneuraminic acid mutarotase